jgi:hypothetical protein
MLHACTSVYLTPSAVVQNVPAFIRVYLTLLSYLLSHRIVHGAYMSRSSMFPITSRARGATLCIVLVFNRRQPCNSSLPVTYYCPHCVDPFGIAIPMPSASTNSSKLIIRTLPSANAIALDPNQITIPQHIINLFERGLPKYISYTALTNAKCRTASALEAPSDTLALDQGVLQLSTPNLSDPNEINIQIPEWLEASSRWVFLIANHLGGMSDGDRKIYASLWRQCHSDIRDRNDFSSRYSDYFAYEKELRVRFISGASFDPSRWHSEIWAAVVDASRERRLSLAIAAASGSTSSSTVTPSRNSFRQSKNRSSSSQTSQNRSEYRGSTSRKDPRDSSKSPRERDSCIFCGSRDHHGQSCPHTSTDFLTRQPDGTWKSSTDISVCFGYNHSSGCRRENCSFAHQCARCGASEHTSQSHPSA